MDTPAIISALLGPGLLLAAVVWGSRILFGLTSRVTKLEALREPMAEKLDALCRDVKGMDRTLSELVGRLRAGADD